MIFQGLVAATHFHEAAGASSSGLFAFFVSVPGGGDLSPSPDGSDLDCPICHDLALASATVLPDGDSAVASFVVTRPLFGIVEGDRAAKAASQFAQRPRGPPVAAA